MATDENVFERRLNLTVQRIQERQQAVGKAFGVGKRGYKQVSVPTALEAEADQFLLAEQQLQG